MLDLAVLMATFIELGQLGFGKSVSKEVRQNNFSGSQFDMEKASAALAEVQFN